MAELRLPAYALISDIPPAKRDGYGSQVLAWNWAQAIGEDLKLVVTHHQHPALSTERIAMDLQAPVVFYPDLARFYFRRRIAVLKSICELVLAMISVPKIVARIKSSGSQRLFAFVSNSAWFLPVADRVARRAGLPLDYYLVDDLEESALLGRHPIEARWARWLEPRMLRRGQRVFTISAGYSEHLQSKYRVHAVWLPIVIRKMSLEYRAYQSATPDVRYLTFIGGVGPLYIEGLRDCLNAISRWNHQESRFRLRLLVMSYTDPAAIAQWLGNHADLEVLFRPPPAQFWQCLHASWAVFVPYSFGPAERRMVSCSFPTKLTDAFLAGRPVVVYGPPYASLPRYFAENRLPICVQSPDALDQALRDIERVDAPPLIQQYESVVRSFHSPEYVRQVLSVEEPVQSTLFKCDAVRAD